MIGVHLWFYLFAGFSQEKNRATIQVQIIFSEAGVLLIINYYIITKN